MRLLALLLPMFLAACGFELRGANVLPSNVERVFLIAPTALRDQVEILLEGSQARLVTDRASADVILTLANPRYERRVLSVDPNTGKEREFELSYTLEMSARRADGSSIVESDSVTLLRDYVFDRATLIGASREESVLREEMLRDAVQQSLYRLRLAVAG